MEPPLPLVDRKAMRMSIAPSTVGTTDVRRGSRSTASASSVSSASSTVVTRRQSKSSTGSSVLEPRGSVGALQGLLTTTTEATPSPTALRLRSLARVVRANQALGTVRARDKYIVSVSGDSSSGLDNDASLGMAAMLDDSVRRTTAPWAHDAKSDRFDSFSPLAASPALAQAPSPSAPVSSTTSSTAPAPQAATLVSVKSKARWKSAGQAAGHHVVAAAATAALHSESTSSGSLASTIAVHRRTNEKQRATKSTMFKRLSSIRSDLTARRRSGLSDALTGATPAPTVTPVYRNGVPDNLDARLFCARSLYKLSCQRGAEHAIVAGGAVDQLADFSDVAHPKLLRFCAATLVNLTTDATVLDVFVSSGGIQALLELSWAPCLHVKILCATALCRLTQHARLAPLLVRARVIIELLAMLALPHDQLQLLVVSSIVNLIFHGQHFSERVFVGEPHATQSQLGVLSVVHQLAAVSTTTLFAAEVLFNLSLYDTSAAGTLRGGGAELLHALAALVSNVIDETGTAGSRFMPVTTAPLRSTRPPWATNTAVVLRMLHLIAATLGNFSARVEFHTVLSPYCIKTLSLLLTNTLRDVGSKFYGAAAESRLQHTVVACSRALANLSANDDVRKHAFAQDVVHMTTRLALVDRHRVVTTPGDARVFVANIVRTLCNLSFSETCTAYFMEFPQVLPLLHAIAVAVEEPVDAEPVVSVDTTAAAAAVAPTRLLSVFTGEDVKEDALVTLLNLAQQAAYANDLVRIVDGKCLALAAASSNHSKRLQAIYSLVLCNLLFESRLQQIVYGNSVIHALIDGFYFFGAAPPLTGNSDNVSGVNSTAGTTQQQLRSQALDIARSDDQERFLAAICIMASEIMDPVDIDRIVRLILDCLKAPVKLPSATAAIIVTPSTTSAASVKPLSHKHSPQQQPLYHPTHHQTQQQQRVPPVRRRGQITCYAAATLYTLARASTHRGDRHNLIHSPEIEATLIAVCERTTSTHAGSSNSDATTSTVCSTTQAFCAASLYHLCASGHVSRRILQALITCCNDAHDESLSLLACAASFAIISFTLDGRNELVACEHLAKALNRLGRSSQPECQQYAAIAACNVSTLQCIWTSTDLKDFIVMALLRANSVQAKQIHAKTLSNLLSHLRTREEAVEDGVLYALMKLSQVMLHRSNSSSATSTSQSSSSSNSSNDGSDALKHAPLAGTSIDEVFSIGLQALFNLSCEHQYHQRLLTNGVMTYLAAPVAGKHAHAENASLPAAPHTAGAATTLASQLTTESRRFAMGIICNLSSFDVNHRELMNAQVSDIIRKYVDLDTETRASAAMALRNLSCQQPWVEMLCDRKTLQLVITFSQCDHRVVKQFAVETLANCSLVTDSLHLYSELRVARAVLVLLESVSRCSAMRLSDNANRANREDGDEDDAPSKQKDADRETCMAALKCLHNVAFDDVLAMNLLNEHAVLRLLSLLEQCALGDDNDACLLIATIVHMLASKPRCAGALVRQRVVSLCALLHTRHATNLDIAHECISVFMKLSTYQQVHDLLTETQAIDVIVRICSASSVMEIASNDLCIRECGAIAIRNLTLSVTEHLALFYNETGLDGFDHGPHDDDDDDGSNASATHKVECSSDELDGLDDAVHSDDDRYSSSPDRSDRHSSRIVERHLLHGVQHFQRELDTATSSAVVSSIGARASDRILLEACAGIANLSTIRRFRVAMVRVGVVETLLRVFQHRSAHASAYTSSTTLTPLQRICAATLHRLAVEDDAAIDAHGLLVPSLLAILKLSDEELHVVRYDCEKVSLYQPTAMSPSRTRERRYARVQGARQPRTTSSRTEATTATSCHSSNSNDMASIAAGLTHVAMVATTHCVKQTYREQKWMLFVLKTTLSSASMIPQLEKKQMRGIGQPRLALQDEVVAAAAAASGGSSSPYNTTTSDRRPSLWPTTTGATVHDGGSGASDALTKPTGGYLLPVHMDKYTVRHDECTGHVDMGPLRFAESDVSASADPDGLCTAGTSITIVDTTVHPLVHRDAPDWGALLQARKFDRHMRTTRRNHRRNPNSSAMFAMLG